MVSRRQIRIKVMQGLYAWYITGFDAGEVFDLNIKEELDEIRRIEKEKGDKGDAKYMVALYYEVIKRTEELDKLIKVQAVNWEIERMALMDRILMQMAICEMLYFEEIPVKVTINEYLELAKRFSTPQSSRFINGVLDGLHEYFRKNEMLHKSGRGLLEETKPRMRRPAPRDGGPQKQQPQ